MRFVFREPAEYGFQDRNGHSGKFFNASSQQAGHLIIECQNKLTVSLIEHEVEFTYYILDGSGYFVCDGEKQEVRKGDLVVIPAGTKFTFGGQLKMHLMTTPRFWPEQEEIIAG